MAVERISIPDLKKKMETKKKLVIVDVRELKETAEGSIPGAIHIPMSQLESMSGSECKPGRAQPVRIKMNELPKNADIVFY